MAKRFYNLEETAQLLGASEDEVREMASQGKIQQFRDRDKLMFKREQIDALVSKTDDADALIPLADSGDTDQMSVPLDASTHKDDTGTSTGISVFETGDVDSADSKAQTDVGEPTIADEEGLALDSAGSGSGLLDLTRESDDTSLGAELLDEIYPGGEEPPGAKTGEAGGAGTASQVDSEFGGSARGLEAISPAPGPATGATTFVEDDYDPAGSGMSTGMLLGAAAGLIITLIVAISAITGVPLQLTSAIAGSGGTLGLYAGGLLLLSFIFGLVGFLVGRSRG